MSKYKVEILTQYSNLQEWDEFVDRSPQGTIFCRSWWLKTIHPKFKIITVKIKDVLVAGLPLCDYVEPGIKKRLVHNMPVLTQTLGILLDNFEGKYETVLSKETSLIKNIVDNIPSYDWFYMQFNYNFTNWLPFYWNKYNMWCRYTYIFPDISNTEDIYSEFNYSKKKNIERAENLVEIKHDMGAKEFRITQENALKKDGADVSYSFESFEKIYNESYNRGCGKTLWAIDNDGNIHSAIFVVFDHKSSYYLCSCVDRDFRSSGANTLLIWEMMKFLSDKTRTWDFEGSMIPGVEESFRQFGARQKPYFVITKGIR